MRRFIGVVAAVILLTGWSAQVFASTHMWTGGAGGVWSSAGNWSGGVPTSGEGGGTIVQFNSASSSTMDIDGLIVDQIHFTGTGNTITIGSGKTLNVNGTIQINNILDDVGGNTIAGPGTLQSSGSVANFIRVTAGNLTISASIAGTTNLTVFGNGSTGAIYTGNNTLTGTTRVNAGTLTLNSGGVNTAIKGPLIIGSGGGTASTVKLLQSAEISDSILVTINSDGTFDTGGFSDTVGSMTISDGTMAMGTTGTFVVSGALSMTGGSITGSGTATLSLQADPTLTSSSTQTATIAPRLSLNGNRTINVPLGTSATDAIISGLIQNGSSVSMLIKAGTGNLLLSTASASTYTGGTKVNDGTLTLNGGSSTVIPGDLTIGDGTGAAGSALVLLGQSSEIANGANVTIAADGKLDLANFFEQITALTMNDGNVELGTGTLVLSSGTTSLQMTGGSITSSPGALQISGSIVATSSAAGGASITANMSLQIATTTFTVNPGTAPELTFRGVISEGAAGRGILKNGTGTMQLGGPSGNSYTGTVTIDKGLMQIKQDAGRTLTGPVIIGNNSDPAGTATVQELFNGDIGPTVTVTINSSGTLDLNGFPDNCGALSGSGKIILNNPATLTVNNDNGTSAFDGTITGSGTFRKAGTGTLTLTGNNSLSGRLQVNDGNLILNGPTDAVCQAATLQIGDGGGAANSAILRLGAANQVANATALDIRGDGQFDLNNFNETIATVAITTGSVAMGTGTLTTTGTVSMTDGVIGPNTGVLSLGGDVTATSSTTGATISASVLLNADRIFTVNSGPFQPELTFNGVVSDGAQVSMLTKSGNGTMRFSNTQNNYTGDTLVNAGVVEMNCSSSTAVKGNLTIGNDTDPPDTATVKNLVSLNIASTSVTTVRASGTFNLNGFTDRSNILLGSGKVQLGSANLTIFGTGIDGVFSGVISGTGGINKAGAATQTFSGDNTYSGATSISAGKLIVNGQQSGAVNVSAGATLSGSGKVGTVNCSGTLEPLNATLTTGNLSMTATSTLKLNLNASPPSAFSSLAVNGTVNITAGAGMTITADPGFGVPVGNKVVLLTNDSNDAITGSFTNLVQSSTLTLNTVVYTVNYSGGSGNDLDMTAQNASPVVAAGASATPNPGNINKTITFSVGATDGNNDPLTYSWDFGDNSQGSGASPTHTYASPGSYSVSVQISDGQGGTVSSSFTQTIANNLPAIDSAAIGMPNPAGVSQTVAFSVAASDADNDQLTYVWNFGDGSQGSGATPTHKYASAGNYSVSVQVSDSFGGTVSSSFNEVVAEPIVGVGSDSDGDGFSDDVEIAAGTNPNNPADSPTGAPATAPLDLTQSKLAIKLNFAKPANDSISFSGTLPIPAGFSSANKTAIIDVGGVVKSVTLDPKGKSPKGNNAFKLTIKAKKGVVAAQTAKFSVKLSKGDFAAALADEGLTNADTNKVTKPVVVGLVFGGAIYQHKQDVIYSAKAGKTGSAKAPK